MEAFFVLLGLLVLAMPVALVVLIFSHAKLRREVGALRSRLDGLTSEHVSAPPPAPPVEASATPSAAPQSVSDPQPVPQPEPVQAQDPTSATPWQGAPNPVPSEPRGPSFAARLAAWLQENWFYAVAAISLALAGLFLVQYGVETGLLTPRARVAAALGFGLALIAGGEVLRRRTGRGDGDTEAASTAYLPSTLSSAGLVSLMGGILAARQLYDLIAPGPALAALFVTALGGLVLGWVNGPLLAGIGLAGGMAAPFLVGGSSDTPEMLLTYFALLTALGLGIDTLRRWAWVSALAVAAGFTAAHLLYFGASLEALAFWLSPFAAGLAAMAIVIPARSLLAPDQAGTGILRMLHNGRGRPIFPTWLASAATLAASLTLLHVSGESATTWWSALTMATALALAIIFWSRTAPALQDLALLPVAALLILIAAPELSDSVRDGLAQTLSEQVGQTETRMPWTITLTLLPAVLITLACAWRSLQPGRYSAFWAGAAALTAPLAGLALEFTWAPADSIGAWPWALHALALGALMTGLATRFAKAEPMPAPTNLCPALATLSALACLAFALTVLLTDAALTLALAATVLVAAALDRRFDLPAMTGFIVAGILALGYRLTIDPGLLWATESPFLEMFAAYGGATAALLAARHLLPDARPHARVFLESGAWTFGAITLSMSLYHLIESLTGHPAGQEHWVIGLHVTVWAALALAQLDRLRLGGPLKWLRVALAAIFGLIATGLLMVSLTFVNPLFDNQTVAGPILINTLAPAYLAPGLMLLLGAWRLSHLPLAFRRVFQALAAALGTFWIALVIRHAWQGGVAMELDDGISQPELYSYTVALLLAGAVLFARALTSGRDIYRRAAIAVIAVAIAKVFLIDISGLDGLARVFSFLLLGLSLAGLAWLNRWVQMRNAPSEDAAIED